MIVLPAIWLLVIGYGLLYIGYRNQSGKPTSFQDAFFGGKGTGTTKPANPIQGVGASNVSGFTPVAAAGQGGGGGGGGSW